jgi:hypothetical protein
MSLRIQHRTHPDELQISLELGSQFGLGEVEPIGSSGSFVLQSRLVSE